MTGRGPDQSRRGFLRGVALGAIASLAPRAFQGTARAEVGAARPGPRYWINICPCGGWDSVWTTDPKTVKEVASGVEVPYPEKDIALAGPHRFGPHLRSLAAHGTSLSVIKGVLVRTANHYTGVEQAVRLRTRTTRRTPAAFDVLGAHRDSQALAHVCLGTPLRQAHTADFFGSGAPDWFGGGQSLFDRIAEMKPEEMRELSGILTGEARSLRRQGDLSDADRRAADTIASVGVYLGRAADAPRFAPETWLTGDLAGLESYSMLGTELQRALWLIENDLTSAVTVLSGLAWDSHINNLPVQGALNPVLSAELAAFVSALSKRSNRFGRLIDQTGFVIASEIGRFPYMNALGGKDHFPSVNVIVGGAPFRRGVSHGRTGKEMEPLGVRDDGRVDGAAERLLLDDLGTTILHVAGIAPTAYGFSGRDLRFLRRG